MGDYHNTDFESPDYVYDAIDNLVSLGSSKSEVMSNTPEAKIVADFIASDKIVIFSKSYCPYCKMAKEVFDKLKEKYTAIELDLRDDEDEIQDVLEEITGVSTVPRVFVKGECLGGGTDVQKLFDSGELVKKL